MVVILSANSLLLKYQLETAIKKYQSGAKIIPDYDFSAPDFHNQFEVNLELAKQASWTGQLLQYFAYGLYLRRITHQEPTNINQRIGVFLHDYFEGIEEAINHLQDTPPYTIDRIKAKDLQEIIKQRPPIQETINSLVSLGQTKETLEEMWYTALDPLYSPRPYNPSDHPPTPPRPSNRTPTPEPTPSNKRLRSPDPWDELVDLFDPSPELTRELEVLEEIPSPKRL